MKSGLENLFEQINLAKSSLVIASSAAGDQIDYSFSDSVSEAVKCESYFSPSIAFYVKKTEPMQMVSKIQSGKKALLKIENWDASELKSRFEKLRITVQQNQNSIASVEAHYQGTTREFQQQWSIQPLLELIEQLISRIDSIDVASPKGLIGAITPKAQSFFEIGWRVVYALFHKDSLLVKPATSGAISAIIWQEILKDCDLPEGLISFVYGPGDSVGRFLMDHPGIRNLSFSGSYESLKSFPLSLEKKYQFLFNGKNSVCVLPDFSIQAGMKDIVRIFVEHNGKGIFSPSRLFVIDTFEKEFISLFIEELKMIPALKSIDDDYGFLPLTGAEKTKLKEFKQKFESEGAKIIFENENFLFYSELPNCSEWHQENLELPIYNLTSVKYSHEMIRWVNNSSFGHSLIIFGSEEKAKKLMQKSEVGAVILNPSPLKFEWVSPVKLSAFGDSAFTVPSSFFGYDKSKRSN